MKTEDLAIEYVNSGSRSIMVRWPVQSEAETCLDRPSITHHATSCLNLCHEMASASTDVYLVVGGSGFLGRHIVNALLERGDSVSVFDIVQRYHDVPFYTGDITEQDSISDALRKVCVGPMAFPTRFC